MRYTPGNKYLVFDTIKKLGGCASNLDIFNSIVNEGYYMSNGTITMYLCFLIREGKIISEKVKGNKYNNYSTSDQFKEIEFYENWRQSCYLLFKQNFSQTEVASILNIDESLVKKIFETETENNIKIKTKKFRIKSK